MPIRAGLLVLLLTLSLSLSAFAGERVSFNDGWLFQKGESPNGKREDISHDKDRNWIICTMYDSLIHRGCKIDGSWGGFGSYTNPDLDDSAWRKLDLPHDWGVEGDFDQNIPGETGRLPWSGTCWYRKHFDFSPADKDKHIFLDFDGAMAQPTVWLNGQYVGGWAYGYSSFRIELTYLLKDKDNVIVVRLQNPPESSRWYPGAGIYRNVWLEKTAPVYVEHWSTQITTPKVTKESATVNVKVTVNDRSGTRQETFVTTSIYRLINGRRSTKPIAVSTSIKPNSLNLAELSLQVKNPQLWNTQTPNLYTAVIEVSQNGKVVDKQETTFGIRTIEFKANQGFLLNDELTEIKGVCLHHDLGALGTAVNTRAMERQIEIMKQMGANAIRTSHNPPAPELLDLADRMGMLVMDEAFDAWVTPKKENDYSRLFADWHEADLRAMVRRDRNHPSVILWSIGNEIPDQKKPDGVKIATELTKIVHEEDSTRPVTMANDVAESGYNGLEKAVDVFGYNYKPHEYAKFRAANPTIPLIGSETASALSSRGEYFFPAPSLTEKGNVMADFQVTGYDFQDPNWLKEFRGQDEAPSVAGEFVWTGFDYLGEPAPYSWDLYYMIDISDPALRAAKEKEFAATGKISVPSRSSYFGIVDTCGFPKDRFYAYQARWRPDLPMAHILPHWNWPDRVGKVTPVQVYTSGDEAELLINGRSLGRRKLAKFQYALHWDDIKYEPGELKVIAYKNGKRWAEDTVTTIGEAVQIMLKADRANINSDGKDLSFITVTVTDKNGRTVPRASNDIRFEISGAGEIAATDNGDATDHRGFKSTSRKAFNGMALVIVRSVKGKSGKMKIRAISNGLKSAEITVNTK